MKKNCNPLVKEIKWVSTVIDALSWVQDCGVTVYPGGYDLLVYFLLVKRRTPACRINDLKDVKPGTRWIRRRKNG